MKLLLLAEIQRKRKPYKLNEETISFIEEIVLYNEKLVRTGSEDAKNTKELFKYFQKQKNEKPYLMTDFTIDNFYKLVRKVKNKIHEKGI
nr:hypothetical protein P5645_01020 [Bacillus subtilis]